MTSPINITQYCIVRSWYMRKRIDHWCSVVPEKIPTLGSTVQWETRQASFPTGTVGPRVGIFLSPLNTNDGFYLSHIPVTASDKDKTRTPARPLTSICVKITSPYRFSACLGFSGSLFIFFQYKMRYVVVSKINNPL